jgi:hypothetical protein
MNCKICNEFNEIDDSNICHFCKEKEYYCNKCDRIIDAEDLTDTEIEEFNINSGCFVCSDCINEEMDGEVKTIKENAKLIKSGLWLNKSEFKK